MLQTIEKQIQKRYRINSIQLCQLEMPPLHAIHCLNKGSLSKKTSLESAFKIFLSANS